MYVCTVQAAEDLVLCAMVRSAIASALGLPVDATPGSGTHTGLAQARTTLPAAHLIPHTSPGMARPLQHGAGEPPRPQVPLVAQVAKVPTFPTATTAQPAPAATSSSGFNGAGGYAVSTSAASPAAGAMIPT